MTKLITYLAIPVLPVVIACYVVDIVHRLTEDLISMIATFPYSRQYDIMCIISLVSLLYIKA